VRAAETMTTGSECAAMAEAPQCRLQRRIWIMIII
jgi:hypothetical protein